MKTEQKVLTFSAGMNFIVALIKIIAGNILGFAALIADGFYTVSDFITDILAIIGSKVGKRRPNKRYPLGYENFENIMQMIMGFVIFLVGVVVIFMSFNIEYKRPSFIVIIPIILVIILKSFSSNVLLGVGKKINSSMLITSSKESIIDVYSSSLLLIVVFLSLFFNKVDMLASIIIGILIILQALKIIYQNSILLIGENIQDEKILKALDDIFQKYHKIKLNKTIIIKQGSFYHLILNISINKNYTIKSLIIAEANIKKAIKKKKLKVSYIDFDIDSQNF